MRSVAGYDTVTVREPRAEGATRVRPADLVSAYELTSRARYDLTSRVSGVS